MAASGPQVKTATGREMGFTADSWGTEQQARALHPCRFGGPDPAAALSLLQQERITVSLQKKDGTVWAWGMNWYGQLGDGTGSHRLTPVRVSGLMGVVAIAAGNYHSVALKADGTVWTWGYNGYGQLGYGIIDVGRATPVQVTTIGRVVAIAAKSRQTLALGPLGFTPSRAPLKGRVWAWGWNSFGQIGDGTMGTDRPIPLPVIDGIVAITTGQLHSMALAADGSIWTWGDNGWGQLGNGSIGPYQALRPIRITGAGAAVAIAAGHFHNLAIDPDGRVFAWGDNMYGQLGDGTLTTRANPVRPLVRGITSLNYITRIAAGFGSSLAIRVAP